MRGFVVAAASSLLLACPAWAEDGACAGFKWPVSREIAAFEGGGLPTTEGGSALPDFGAAADLKLVPQEQVTYPVPPAHAPKHAPGFGGAFPLPPITAADTYQVTVSDEAWVDVVQGGRLIKQVGFTGSHSCKAVRKSVRFSLSAGPATVEISDAASGSLKIEVSPQAK